MSGKKAKQERGQARIQQLMEMFPEMTRVRVVQADALREGIKHTPLLDEVGTWALPDTHDHYEYDYDEHVGEADAATGYSYTPKYFYFKDGAQFQLRLCSTSPYEVKYDGRGYYRLHRDDEPIEEVTFPPCPQWYRGTTSSGKPMGLVVGMIAERNPFLYFTTFCEYFKEGNQCLFCNLNPTGEHFADIGQERLLVKREQDIYEVFMACAQDTGIAGGITGYNVMSGGFLDRKKEAEAHMRTYEILKRAMKDSGCTVPLRYVGQAQEEEELLRLKEAGVIATNNPMEVWDPKLFPIVCPGKAKHVGREGWIRCLLKAVEIFGWGRAVSSFVVGVEMVPPFGFKSEDEAAESVLEGFQFLTSHGVHMIMTDLRTNPGSWVTQSGAQRPRTEYILRIDRERQKLLKEYNLPESLR